jgi:hypothetical protein
MQASAVDDQFAELPAGRRVGTKLTIFIHSLPNLETPFCGVIVLG